MEEIRDEIKELLETKQYTRLRQRLEEMNDADIAAVLDELEEEELLKIFRILPKSTAADVFAYLEVDSQQFIITSLSDKEAGVIIDNLMSDDAADFLDEMPANIVKRLLSNVSPETRREVNDLLRYPEDSAGSIMTVEYADLKENMTVTEAIDRIRKIALDRETVNICYVLDNGRKLVGTVALRYLLLSDPEDVIGDIMNDNIISIPTHMDQEQAAAQFQKYGFTAMPVVDSENRMVGIITVDDIVDILQEEATEDIEKMAAVMPSDRPYLRTSVLEGWKKRIPWLLLLMISSTFTSKIISSFESALSACVILTAYIPMLMDTGGNAGGQASAIIIRGLSLNEVAFKDWFKVAGKELRIALLCGSTLSVANFIKLVTFDRISIPVAIVICITLIAAVMIAQIVGCSLPMLAKKLGFDPAVMASPFITTIVDALSLLVYFSIASRFLGI